MSFEVKTIPYFEKQSKKLSKKYASFKNELENLIDSLATNPKQGTPLGKNCYKIRFVIKSKGKGKRGGARVITHIVIVEEDVFLLTVYDKSEKENVSNKELAKLLKMIQS